MSRHCPARCWPCVWCPARVAAYSSHTVGCVVTWCAQPRGLCRLWRAPMRDGSRSMPTDRWPAEARRLRRQRGQLRAGWAGGGLRPRSEWTWLMGGEFPGGVVPATEREAMGLPPFGRGVALLANAVAGTDWFAARWDPAQGIYQRLATQPAVVTDPDPTVTPWNYRWAAAEDG